MRGDTGGDKPLSGAILLKRNVASTWDGLLTCDNGSTTIYTDQLEFNPSNQLAEYIVDDAGSASAATFNDTTNWMIVGFTWGGTAGAGNWVWRWKIGAGAWSSEAETVSSVQPSPTLAGSGYRHVIGNDPTLGDDSSMDVVCAGLIAANLSQATFESLTLTDIASWDAVFTGAGSACWGFETVGSQVDRTGNGANEVTRNGVTLVSDPASWSWGAAAATSLVIPRRAHRGLYMR